MRVSRIYTDTLREMRSGTRRINHQGGAYSGKTVNILGTLATLASEDDIPTVTTVTSMSLPHLKGGALRDFENYVYPSFKNSIAKYHKTDHKFTFRSGSLIEFKAFEDEFAARGAKRQRLFVNEANRIPEMVFFQLDSRSDQTILDYNPTTRFYAHEKIIGFPGNVTFYSDHRHNPFLTEQKHQEIENYVVYERNPDGTLLLQNGKKIIKSGDEELFKVYARGLTGNVSGVIFPNWEMIDDSEFPPDDGSEVYCVDFGYTIDPTALFKLKLVGNTLFAKELAYEPGLPAVSIVQILLANGFRPDEMELYCEHDPDMISDLRKYGATFATFARKGTGSIKAGIELLKRYKVKYTHLSRNLHRERSMYVWITDKVTGKLTNVPIDSNNHCFDAIRYGAYSRYLRANE